MTVYKRNPEQKYKMALDTFIEQLKSHPKTKSGGYWHKKIYPWQMWLDGIFMAINIHGPICKGIQFPGMV